MHLRIFSSVLLIEMFDLRVKDLKWRNELFLNHYKMSLQSSLRLNVQVDLKLKSRPVA